MCGRFSLTQTEADIEARFGAKFYSSDLVKRYNVAPSQLALVITDTKPGELQLFKWGLIPSWAKDGSIGNKMINARSESLREKPSFRNLIRKRRCLVIADGFYEWRLLDSKKKQPVRITMKDSCLFAMAGLWDEWTDPASGEITHSFTIITVPANELVNPVHDRMPAILQTSTEKKWLSASTIDLEIDRLLTSYPAEQMQLYDVSEKVNTPLNDSPDLILPKQNLFTDL